MSGAIPLDDRLTLVSGSAENGYYHVKTEDDVIGWVLATGITVSPSPGTAPIPPQQPPLTGQCDLPSVGSHVRVVGVYVQDTFHAQWMEVHPLTSIEVE